MSGLGWRKGVGEVSAAGGWCGAAVVRGGRRREGGTWRRRRNPTGTPRRRRRDLRIWLREGRSLAVNSLCWLRVFLPRILGAEQPAGSCTGAAAPPLLEPPTSSSSSGRVSGLRCRPDAPYRHCCSMVPDGDHAMVRKTLLETRGTFVELETLVQCRCPESLSAPLFSASSPFRSSHHFQRATMASELPYASPAPSGAGAIRRSYRSPEESYPHAMQEVGVPGGRKPVARGLDPFLSKQDRTDELLRRISVTQSEIQVRSQTLLSGPPTDPAVTFEGRIRSLRRQLPSPQSPQLYPRLLVPRSTRLCSPLRRPTPRRPPLLVLHYLPLPLSYRPSSPSSTLRRPPCGRVLRLEEPREPPFCAGVEEPVQGSDGGGSAYAPF